MKKRISWKKFTILTAMSAFGLWASTMVFVVYYTLKSSLPFCPPPSQGISWFPRVDCGAVLSSPYSSIFGVPLELVAIFYFVINLGLIYLISFGPDRAFRPAFRSLFVWRFAGLIIVPYLLFVELVILHAICIYCTMMHVAIVVDFVIISYLIFYKKGLGTYGQAISPQASEETGHEAP
ncbi:MAG TPA: vitamin K epoxide reductase family protein [Candidatus Dormibacteraeota bacterium]|nr:vitamin K epoxide reductase family protein [Candidatus Dormibacteraeota bacterium]